MNSIAVPTRIRAGLRAAIPQSLKFPARWIGDVLHDRDTRRYLNERAKTIETARPPEAERVEFKQGVAAFVNSLCTDAQGIRYRFSHSCSEATLYASTYACLTYGLIGKLAEYGEEQKCAWVQYFDSFQNPDDGLYYDPVVRNRFYDETDWWGARHLALHVIVAYTILKAKPRHRFKFLDRYCESGYIDTWLDAFDWKEKSLGDGDIDNKIMNVGGLLQYRRDIWQDADAGDAVEHLKQYLLDKINPATGLWGRLGDRYQRSRMVQFAYHLFPLFFYDGQFGFDAVKIVETVLDTQNAFGGYGVRLNSSACEDIDSVEILIRLHGEPSCPDRLRSRISQSVDRAQTWIMQNQVEDGGFVFRLNEPYFCCHEQFSSARNEGALFPTWFRTLSLALIDKWKGGHNFLLDYAPGYIVPLKPGMK